MMLALTIIIIILMDEYYCCHHQNECPLKRGCYMTSVGIAVTNPTKIIRTIALITIFCIIVIVISSAIVSTAVLGESKRGDWQCLLGL